MTIESNQNNSISGLSAGGARVGTGFAPLSSSSMGKSRINSTIENSTTSTIVVTEPTKTTPSRTARFDTSEKEVKEAVQKQIEQKDIARLNDYVQNIRRRLEFRVDEATNRTVVTVIDQDTQEVIRQIPSEAALKLVQRLNDLQGHSGSLLYDRT